MSDKLLKLEVISLFQLLVKISEDINFTGFIRIKQREDIPGFYILLNNGNIIGITGGVNTLEEKLKKYEWIAPRRIDLAIAEAVSKKEPLLNSLIKYGLDRQKVEQLYEEQLGEIIARFGLKTGFISWGKITNKDAFQYQEITGISIAVHEFIFKALAKDIPERYKEKLPEKTLIIKSSFTKTPISELGAEYQEILRFADKDISLEKIARKLDLNLEEVKRRVFILERLTVISTGLPKDKISTYVSQLSPRQKGTKNNLVVTGERDFKTPLLTLSAINLFFILLTFIGFFKNAELGLLNVFFKFRGTERNNNITLVTIDDQDISQLQDYPVTDGELARAIKNVSRYEPAAIGVDIYRDRPQNPGHQDLLRVYESTSNLIGVDKIGGSGVNPPPVLEDYGAVGFADLIEDSDKILRRALISLNDSEGNTRLGLGSFLAYLALAEKGIEFQQIDEDTYKIGMTTVDSLNRSSGGYWNTKIEGWQLLLDWRHKIGDFENISFTDVFNGSINPQQIKNKIVIFGVNAPSKKDYIYTPFSRSKNGQVIPEYGMVAHANIASMLYEIGMGRKPFTIFSKVTEVGYFIFYSFIGIGVGILGLEVILKQNKSRTATVVCQSFFVAGVAFISALLAFFNGIWIPVITPAFLAIVCGLIVNLEYKNNIENLVYVDRKLKIPNRSYFDHVFANILVENIKQDVSTGLILVEINYKAENNLADKYEEKLAKIAKIFKTVIRAADSESFVARYEKAYLAVIVHETNLTKINNLIADIKTEIKARKQEFHEFKLNFGISINDEIINNPESMKVAAAENIH